MITTTIVNLLLFPIQALFDTIPQHAGFGLNTLAQTITSSSYFPNLGWINDYFPLDTAMTALAYILSTIAIMLIANIAIWIYHQFWGS